MNAQRILLTWGVICVLISMCGGLYLGPQVNPTRAARKAHYEKAFEHLAAQESKDAMEELRKGIEIEDNLISPDCVRAGTPGSTPLRPVRKAREFHRRSV